MPNLIHITEIGDDVLTLARRAAWDDIKTDAPECAVAVSSFEALGTRIAETVEQKPIVLASSINAATALAAALRSALAGNLPADQRSVIASFAALLEREARSHIRDQPVDL